MFCTTTLHCQSSVTIQLTESTKTCRHVLIFDTQFTCFASSLKAAKLEGGAAENWGTPCPSLELCLVGGIEFERQRIKRAWRWETFPHDDDDDKIACQFYRALKNTLCLKKVSTFKLSVTLSNLNRFSKFLHC